MKLIEKPKIREQIFNKYDRKCAYCGIELSIDTFSIDHIDPIFRNYKNFELDRMKITRGEERIENLNPSCKSCNSSKSTLTLEKWRGDIKQKHFRLMKYEPSYRLLHRFGMLNVKNEVTFYFEKISKNGIDRL